MTARLFSLNDFPPRQAPVAASTPSTMVDHPNGTLTGSDLVRLGLFGDLATTGPAVTDQTAMQVGTVYSCLSKLAGAVSQLPIHEYRDLPDGERQRVTPASPIWWALNETPDAAWTASAWKQWIVRCVKLRGDQHTEIVRATGGGFLGFRVHHPDNVHVRRVEGRLVYDCLDQDTGRVYGVDQDDMLHFTGFGFDGVRSMSAIKWAARSAISGELAAARHMLRGVDQGGMPRIALEMPGAMRPEQAQELREAFQRIYGRDGNTLPLVLSNGAKAHELSISPVDMELLSTRKFDKQTICEVMGVPPIIIGNSDGATAWGTGIEQIMIGWVRFDLAPLLAGWSEEINRKLYRRAGRFVEFQIRALLQGDTKAQAEYFRAALGGPGTGDGWMTLNEVRRLLNLPRIDDAEADRPYRAQRATQPPTAP